MCGENRSPRSLCPRCRGSPPRVRGKPSISQYLSGDQGITPACAGKTRGLVIDCYGIEDHPRVCGENLSHRARQVRSKGSPPRVRGKLCAKYTCTHMYRITPACAGKTAASGEYLDIVEDHPRVCGENGKKLSSNRYYKGSPPRVRGKL